MLQETVGIRHDEGLGELMANRLTSLVGARLRLFKDSLVDVSRTTSHGELELNEANFSGYAPAVLTWSAVGPDAEGGLASLSSRAFFQATDADVPNSIKGAWLEQSVALAQEIEDIFVFPAPVPITVALAYLAAVVRIREPVPDEISVDT